MALVPDLPSGSSEADARRFLTARRLLAVRESVHLEQVPAHAQLRRRVLGEALAVGVDHVTGSRVDVADFVVLDADLRAVAPSAAQRMLEDAPRDVLQSVRGRGFDDRHLTALRRQRVLQALLLTQATVTVDGLAPLVESAQLHVLGLDSPHLDDRLADVLLEGNVDMAIVRVTGLSPDGLCRLIVLGGVDHLVVTGVTPGHATGMRALRLTSVRHLTVVLATPLSDVDVSGLERAIGPAVGTLTIEGASGALQPSPA